MTGDELSDGAVPIRISLLGRFTVDRDGQEVAPRAFGGRLARQLLRLLALRRGVLVQKDTIAEALWAGNAPADAPGNIEILVSRLRRALGNRTLIQTGPGGYVLAGDSQCWVDAEAFLAAVQAGRTALAARPGAALASFRTALEIWRGEPLPEDSYADWAQADRRCLSLAHLEALDGAAAAALQSRTGTALEAAYWARRAVATDPLRESSVLLLVRALATAGDQVAAMAAFDEYRNRLAAETGLEPTPQARQVRQRIVACQPEDGDRLAGLPARSREMLALLALLGRPAPPRLLATASGASLHAVLDTLEGLGSAGLVSSGPQGWALSRELTPETVSGAGRPAQAARCHALLAMALRRSDADPAEVATHLAASGDSDGAATGYLAAARRELDRISDREAIRLAEAGLRLGPPPATRAELLEVRGEACRRHGRFAAARADFTTALDSLADPAARSRVLAKLAVMDARTTDAARGAELAGLAIAEAGDEPSALGLALAAGAIIDLTEGHLARARYRARRAARLLERSGDSGGSARLLYWQAMACFIDGDLREAVTRLDRLAQLPVSRGEVLRFWSPRATRGHALVFLGRAADGLTEIDKALARARAAGHRPIEAECLWRRAEALAALGRGLAAIESAQGSARIAVRIRHAEWTAAAHRGLGIACETAGLPGPAESGYRRSLQAAEGSPFFRAWAAARLGALLAREGRPDEAAPYVRAALSGGSPLTWHEARWAHAELLASQGDRDGCRTAAATALAQAQDAGCLILVPRLAELAGR